MGRIWIACLLPLALGCQFKGDPPSVAPSKTSQPPPTVPRVWTARATSMRIYPTTRFVRRDGQAILEARIELLDEMGDPVKGAGQFRFELVDVPNPMNQTLDVRLYEWDAIELKTLKDQIEYYDKITRGYHFPLQLDNLDVAERRTMLRARFERAAGAALNAELLVKTDW